MKFFANLKSNHTRKSFKEYALFLDENLKEEDVKVFPPASAFLDNSFKFDIGAQNFYPAQNGSFTGEISAQMLEEFGIKSVIIGHSERRTLGENEEFLKEKFEFAKEKGWEIIYCIGESEAIKNEGKTKEFLSNQIKNLDLNYENLILAYEPIWAIGTGKSANNEDIDEVLGFLRTLTKAPLLYGGSVNLKNIKEISNTKFCDGVLVGTASFDAKNFIELIKA